jgi:hypothetical protein
MIEDLILKLDWPGWLFFLLLIFLASIAFVYYFRTLPPLSKLRRILLTSLRAAGLIIAVFVILSPILQIVFKNDEKPTIAVLFDNSASMGISDSYGERGDSLKFVSDNLSRFNSQDSINFQPFYFDLSLRRARSDSPSFKTDGTNIENAVKSVSDSLAGQNLQGIVLVSDGIYNQGANPVLLSQHSTLPIYPVMIGDSTLPKDVIVKRVQTNQVTYVNKELPFEIVLWQNGFDGERGVVSLNQGNKRVTSETVTFSKSGFEQKVQLHFTPRKEGDFNYTVSVHPQTGEITVKNNSKSVRIRVLKSKLRVLILSGAPNFDRHFLSYFGSQLKDYDFIFFTEKSTGNYFEGSFDKVTLDSVDLVILHGFPTAASNSVQVDRIFQSVEKRKLPVFWFLSRTTSIQTLNSFNDLLPFQLSSRLNPLENVSVKLTSGGNLHPAMQLSESETANKLLWTELPPLEIYGGLNPKPGSQILLQSDEIQMGTNLVQKELPVLFAYRHREIKHLVFAASNFGFWHFQLQEDLSRDQMMLRFMDRSIRWLVNREDINQIQIQPVQNTFNLGEAVTFSGEVYDELYQPIRDARVNIKIVGGEKEISEEINPLGGGFYQHSFGGLPEGEFDYVVKAEKNGKEIGERSGKFSIEPFYLEFQHTAGNVELMRQLAIRSGGRFYRPSEFTRRFPQTPFESRVNYSTSEHFLWDHLYWLFLLIFLFGTEWFFRKRWGLL